jgi:hypothetical protein
VTDSDVRLEGRLTRIEDQMVAGFDRLDTRAKGIEVNLHALTNKVGEQNGRISKLEVFKSQGVAVIAVILAAGPFVFAVLDRWLGGT